VTTLVDRLRNAGCVFAEDEAAVLTSAATGRDHLEQMVLRRVAGEPLEQVVGWADFAGIRVRVDPGVFVPRRRSELLARRAVDLTRPGTVVVDLCCGTGAIGGVICSEVADVTLHASDLDPAAAACAATNLEPHGGIVHQGDLYDALPPTLQGRVDVMVANAPYVPTRDIAFMPAEAREHEPAVALDGGVDGVDLHRRIASGALDWIAPRGHLLIETSDRQEPVTTAILRAAGLTCDTVRDADLDATVVIAQAP